MNTHNIDYLTGFAEGAFTTLFTIAGVWVIFSLTEVLIDMEQDRRTRIAAIVKRDNLAQAAGSALEEFSPNIRDAGYKFSDSPENKA